MRLTSDGKILIPNYVSNREIFLHLAEKAKLKLIHQSLPGLGWQNESLTQDYAVFDQGSSTTLVHMSGVHGIEGYLGSSIQEKILSTIATGFQDAKINVILVHAVNPFGMSWYRRVNAENIDLNRNGIADNDRPINKDNSLFADFLQSKSAGDFLKSAAPTVIQLAKLGLKRSSQAIAGGQWEYPLGLFYGGLEVQEEIKILTASLKQLTPTAKKYFVIDVHTGLGPWAKDSLLVNSDQPQILQFFRGATQEGSIENRVIDTSPSGDSQGYRSQCTIDHYLKLSLQKMGVPVHYITHEFGTHSAQSVLFSMIRENALYQKSPRDGERIQILLKAFFPSEKNWLYSCRNLGLKRFSQILQALESQSTPV